MRGGVLGEFFFHFSFIGSEGALKGGAAFALNAVEHIRIKTGHMHGVPLHKAGIKCCGWPLAHGRAKEFKHRVVDADVEHRTGAAPIGVLAGGAHAQQHALGELIHHRADVGQITHRNVPHSAKRQSHSAGHGQVQPDQPLQALGPPTMGVIGDWGGLGHQRGMGVILHCSTFRFQVQHRRIKPSGKGAVGAAIDANARRHPPCTTWAPGGGF